MTRNTVLLIPLTTSLATSLTTSKTMSFKSILATIVVSLAAVNSAQAFSGDGRLSEKTP